MDETIILPQVGEGDRVQGVSAEPTILHWLVRTYGGGGTIDLKPNAPKELIFPAATLHYSRLHGRININDQGAVLDFDDPKPVATGTKFLIPFKATVNSIKVTDNTIEAVTNLGTYEVWSKS